MMRRRLIALTMGATLSYSAASLILPGVSQGATPACPPAPTAVPTSATIPPELTLLEQKTAHLHFTTIRISSQTVLDAEEGKLVLNARSEMRRSPRESFTAWTTQEFSKSGKSSGESNKTLELGGMIYRYEPTVTRGDGGRPWVSERSHTEDSKAISLEPLPALLTRAQSIVALGAETLDGQQVSRFAITFAPGAYPQSDLPLGELLEKACPQPVKVELVIALSGLPVAETVSTSYSKEAKTITVSSTTRILATNFHFKPLTRPPRRRTIGGAALHRFLAAKLSKELAKHKPQRAAGHKTL